MNSKAYEALRHELRLLERKHQLLTHAPEAYAAKSILYIGANVRRMEMLDLFYGRKCEIDVLEIWPKNVEKLRAWDKRRQRFRRIVEGDVCELTYEKEYHLALWWHGPEHVRYPDRLERALARLERAARRLVVLACPWGECPQDDAYGNPHEQHLKALYPKDLMRFGYQTNCIGKVDVLGSNLLAWKEVDG